MPMTGSHPVQHTSHTLQLPQDKDQHTLWQHVLTVIILSQIDLLASKCGFKTPLTLHYQPIVFGNSQH